MNCLFAVKLSSDILQCSIIYKLYTNSLCFSIAFARTGTVLLVVREVTPINKRIILESKTKCAKGLFNATT